MKTKGRLFLIPVPLAEETAQQSFTPFLSRTINEIHEYIVESEKSARKFLKLAGIERPQSELVFHDYGKHARERFDYARAFRSLEEGNDVGLMSDAGSPAIADPGSEVVAEAHRRNIRVVPLVGPNSMILALMASGFNGQKFAFHGYIPIDKKGRQHEIKALENEAYAKKQSQLFIETPFRNNALLKELVQVLLPTTLLCVAADLTSPTEQIIVKPVSAWRRLNVDFHKRPAIFIIHPGERHA